MLTWNILTCSCLVGTFSTGSCAVSGLCGHHAPHKASNAQGACLGMWCTTMPLPSSMLCQGLKKRSWEDLIPFFFTESVTRIAHSQLPKSEWGNRIWRWRTSGKTGWTSWKILDRIKYTLFQHRTKNSGLWHTHIFFKFKRFDKCSLKRCDLRLATEIKNWIFEDP